MSSVTTGKQVKSRIDGTVGVIALDNPPHQFMTTRMVRELDALTLAWQDDPRVRAIVITGTKPGTFITHFSVEELERSRPTGQDRDFPPAARGALERIVRTVDRGERLLAHLPSVRASLEASVRKTPLRAITLLHQVHRVFSRLERMDKAVIAAINGTAMGGGCELALACDYRLMARGDHVIGLVEVLGAIIPGAGGTQRLAATVGKAKAVEMMLDGALVAPDEAARIGLVTKAVDAGALMDEAMTLARRLATRSPTAVGGAKRAVRIGSTLPIEDGLAYEMLAFVMAGISPDAREAAKQYLVQFRNGRSAREIFDAWREGREGRGADRQLA
jgi:enoyl-CoA hydratase/carnithine racemase